MKLCLNFKKVKEKYCDVDFWFLVCMMEKARKLIIHSRRWEAGEQNNAIKKKVILRFKKNENNSYGTLDSHRAYIIAYNGYLIYQALAHCTQYQLLPDTVVLTGPCTHVA